jgi:hypothetical protein
MRASTQAFLMIVGSGIGIVATIIDGASGHFSVWNGIAIIAFAGVIGAGLSVARRVR